MRCVKVFQQFLGKWCVCVCFFFLPISFIRPANFYNSLEILLRLACEENCSHCERRDVLASPNIPRSEQTGR